MSICDCNQGRLACSCKTATPEVKRISVFMHGPNKKVDMVEASHLDAAQSELAALREELANYKEANSALITENANKFDLLTAAEQRNATLTSLLERWYEANCNDLVHVEDGAYRIVLDTNEALAKPTESGASDTPDANITETEIGRLYP